MSFPRLETEYGEFALTLLVHLGGFRVRFVSLLVSPIYILPPEHSSTIYDLRSLFGDFQHTCTSYSP